MIKTCIVHLIRHSLAFASRKERRDIAAALKPIHRAANAENAREQLEGFAAGHWGKHEAGSPPGLRLYLDSLVAGFTIRGRTMNGG